ncbi:MAG: SOS response-associated peptidase [Ilumatobacteraceae bacterium]
MCGRFVRVPSTTEIMTAFEVQTDRSEVTWKPSYNVAPSQRIPIVSGHHPRLLDCAVWGFHAPWKGPTSLVINARVESVFEKRTFRRFTSEGRCVIPLSGYYEWLTNEETKQDLGLGKGKFPFYITADDDSPLRHGSMMAAAGLISREDGESRCVLLTRSANQSIAWIHDRMPLLLDLEAMGEWLGPSPMPEIGTVVAASEVDLLATRASRSVNSVRNNSASLLEADEPDTLF